MAITKTEKVSLMTIAPHGESWKLKVRMTTIYKDSDDPEFPAAKINEVTLHSDDDISTYPQSVKDVAAAIWP